MGNDTYRQPKAPFILIPLYIYPLRKGETWAPLFEAVRRYPDLSFVVIVNPDSGPCQGLAPDENYLAVLSSLVEFRNVTILGYVAVCWGERKYDEVAQDVRAYYHWEQTGHRDHHKPHDNNIPTLRIDGIFLDEAPSKATEESVTYMSKPSQLARSLARSADRPWNNTRTYRVEHNTKTADLTHNTTSPDHQVSKGQSRAENDPPQSQAPSSPCTIVYNPGTPPSDLSLFNSSTQADYIVVFEQTLATWPTPRSKSSNPLWERRSWSFKEPANSSVSVAPSPLFPSPTLPLTSTAVPASDLDPSLGPVPDPEEMDPIDYENSKDREYIASCLSSLSRAERAKSIAIAHSVVSLEDQLRFAAEAVEYGLAGHFATSSGDYSSWSGLSYGEKDCLRSESNRSVSLGGGSLDDETVVDTTVNTCSHWMTYVEEANRLASLNVRGQTEFR